ncbi:MAG: SIR2 family protein [Pseudomonadota bacterium]
MDQIFKTIAQGLAEGRIVPYLGPGALPQPGPVPADASALATWLSSQITIPHKIRTNLTAAAQYIENFKHRKTLHGLMVKAYLADIPDGPVQDWLAGLPKLPLAVSVWYDDTVARAQRARPSWGRIQGLSQAEHHGQWYGYYGADGQAAEAGAAQAWETLVYEPWGAISPAGNFLVSDSDFVEVLTEIDIQTPIPPEVQERRRDRHFLFLGCRFRNQLERIFARQIMKRSSDRHWAIIERPYTRNEARFMEEQRITPISMPLEAFFGGLRG